MKRAASARNQKMGAARMIGALLRGKVRSLTPKALWLCADNVRPSIRCAGWILAIADSEDLLISGIALGANLHMTDAHHRHCDLNTFHG
jgi:hypothetical protein